MAAIRALASGSGWCRYCLGSIAARPTPSTLRASSSSTFDRRRDSRPQADLTPVSEKDKETPDWRLHRQAMKERFPDGWDPPLKLSRPTMALIRSLHNQDPSTFSTPALASRFKTSPEAIRRILKSKWRMAEDQERELETRQEAEEEEKRERNRRMKANAQAKKLRKRMEREPWRQPLARRRQGLFGDDGSEVQEAEAPERERAPRSRPTPSTKPSTASFARLGTAVPEVARPPSRLPVQARSGRREPVRRMRGPFEGAKMAVGDNQSGSEWDDPR